MKKFRLFRFLLGYNKRKKKKSEIDLIFQMGPLLHTVIVNMTSQSILKFVA